MGHRYPQPDNEDGFEQLCVRFYRKFWENGGLQLFAKRGEKQDGIDIYDPLSLKPVGAIQCKFHETNKTIPPSEIKKEVEKAENSPFDLERYVIATTARKTRNAQETVVELNRRVDKQFTVEIHFWEDICTEVEQFGLVKAELIIYGKNILAGANSIEKEAEFGSLMTPPSNPGRVADATGSLAEIEELLDKRRFDVARYKIEKQSEIEASKSLPIQEQYLLLRFRGRLALEDSDWTTASKMFLDAYEIAPESDQAKQNHVLGLTLSGDQARAFEAAIKHIESGVRTNVMAIRFVDCVSSLDQLTEQSSLIDQYRDTDADLNTALCHKYIQLGAFKEAKKAADRALAISSNSPHAHLAAAMAAHSEAEHLPPSQRIVQLHSAIKHYKIAEKRAAEEGYPKIIPEALVNRGAAYMLLNQKEKAAADFRAVVNVLDAPKTYVNRSLAFFLQEEDYLSAWELLDAVDCSTTEGQYLALVTEYEYADEQGGIIEEMLKLADEAPDHETDCRSMCVQWSIDQHDLEQAERCLSDEFMRKHSFQAQTLWAWIHLEAGSETAAKNAVEKALSSSIENAHKQDLQLLAHVLIRLKDDANALGLLDEVVCPGVLDDDMRTLINCAQRLGRHDMLLRLCRELREAGTSDNKLQRLEIDLLNRYAPEQALNLTKEFSTSSDSPELFTAYHNFLLIRLKQSDELTLNPSVLPSASQIVPQDAFLVVVPYLKAQRYDDALRFLYAQRRQYFEDEQAQKSYMDFFLTYSNHLSILKPPKIVTEDCAVSLMHGNKEERWVIIENERPLASRDEFSSTHELPQRLIGRKVGDTVELPGKLIQNDKATICEIQSKFVRAFQECLNNFRRWFPESSALQKIDVGTEDNFDPSAIIQSLKERREHIEECLQLYLDKPCSLYLFANGVGIDELDAIQFLASHERGIVKCCQTMPDQFLKSVEDGFTTQAIVLDLSTIITLTLFDAWSYLAPDKKYYVSQITSELIDNWLRKAQLKQSMDGGVAILDDSDGLIVQDSMEDEKEQRLQIMREMIDKHCQRKSSPIVAKIDPQKRKLYEKSLGVHNLESIGVASECSGVLWSDDLVVGFICQTDFGIDHVWTQLALRRFLFSGSLTATEYELLTAKLMSWNYTSIVWNAQTLIAAGEEANWDVEAWPLKQCLGLVGNSGPQGILNAHIVLEFIKLLRRSSCIELKQGAVIRAALDSLGTPRMVRWMLGRLNSVFPIDYSSVEFVQLELQYWLSNKLL